jgi:hypothetical protein
MTAAYPYCSILKLRRHHAAPRAEPPRADACPVSGAREAAHV